MSTSALRRPLVARTRLRGQEAAWVRPALIGLLAATAVAYLWNLTASGDANSFYAAAVQAGTKSWKAFLFGSLDSSNFITVDKPPASLWVMALSGRIFGFSSFSMLAPQVLEGVAAVALLYAGVKRWFGAGAGLLAGALLAVTPVAALMFRFNNPDALLVCLLVAAAYCLVRALERASTRWMVAVGTLIGLAFLAKMLQAFLVLPGFALVYLVAAPTGLRRRVGQLLAGGLAIAASAGWWVALVALWPVGSRPMIDGSPDNNIFNLILGYNGLGRIFGATGPGGGGGGANFSGPAGLLRLFDGLMGGQASWLLPAALLALAVGLWSTRRAPRTDRRRAALLMWGSWLVVSGLVFSVSTGVIHTYYTVALAPAIAALVAIGAVGVWRERHAFSARLWLALAVAVTAGWSWALLDRTPDWEPWLRPLIGVSAALAVVCLLAPSVPRRLIGLGAVLAAVCCAGGSGRVQRADDLDRSHRLDPVGRSEQRSDHWRRWAGWVRRGRAPGRSSRARRAGIRPAGRRRPDARRAGPRRGGWRRAGPRHGGPRRDSRTRCRRDRQRLTRQGPGGRLGPLPLGRRRVRIPDRCVARARDRRRSCDGDRRLQRAGREPQPRCVQAVRGGGRDPLLRRRRRCRRSRRSSGVRQRDRELGAGPLQVRDDRRADGLRPDPGAGLSCRSATLDRNADHVAPPRAPLRAQARKR